MDTDTRYSPVSTAAGKAPVNRIGLLFTLAATLAFAGALLEWGVLWRGPQKPSPSNTPANERRAYLNLYSIAAAQTRYIKTDWDGDGKRVYAKYYTHLWTSVDTAGRPLRLDLIPRKLAFASQPARAIDGYWYLDLHDRVLPLSGRLDPLDYEKEWAVLAIPLTDGQNEMLHFLADSSGRIYYKYARYVPEQYVDDRAAKGWQQIHSVEQLNLIRKNPSL